MIHFDLPKEKSSIIKVIGVGGGGSNAVNHMFSQNIEGVNFIICNTDAQAIAQSHVPNKVQLGPHLTQGLGAGANPDIGRQATEESLEEIKQILEVNTKMAFITAGMGGGTGTGGAPIIAKICKDLGILTVGIITTPFSYEGRKRQLQAEEGIKVMKQFVDTLLVISNDKLRHQFGNLKMKEAFAKADNVLATAAKCITDVITTTGQINVDFADVCTVMRSGGVAILGSAVAKGDNRAQKAIEEALNSPLLNDNDIRGAKWILININSCEGEHEFTMDEVETIQNYLLSQAGEGSDVIMGLGYDNSLGANLGITLIATGFEHKDPFNTKPSEIKPVPKTEEKILIPLVLPDEEQKMVKRPVLTATEIAKEPQGSKDLAETKETPAVGQANFAPLPDALQPKLVSDPKLADAAPPATPLTLFNNEDTRSAHSGSSVRVVDNNERAPKIEWVLSPEPEAPVIAKVQVVVKSAAPVSGSSVPAGSSVTPGSSVPVGSSTVKGPYVSPPASGPSGPAGPTGSSGMSKGYLTRPSNIYDEEAALPDHAREEEAAPDMQLVFRDNTPQKEVPPVITQATPSPVNPGNPVNPANAANPANQPGEDPAGLDDTDDPKRRAAERISKLRNLSFNINSADPNNEFETVPAYIRRNLELYNTISNVENFYSNYEVKTDENNNTAISTINTFLDGKRPD